MNLYIKCNTNDGPTFNKKDYLLEAARRMDLDNVFNWEPGVDADCVLNVEPFGQMEKGKKWTGIWEIDVMFDRPELSLSDWIASDVVFLANTFVPQRMENFEGRKVYMFQACDPVIHKRKPSIPQLYDFVFSGSTGLQVYEPREKAMNVLRQAGFSFMDYGKGHPPQRYMEFLNTAKVQFIRSASKKDIGDSQVEQRFFECLALGPVLKDYHPALETLGLVEGEDFFWYKDDKEMLEKMHYLIDNPDFAQKMADSGRTKALLYHTYDNRLATILNFIREDE